VERTAIGRTDKTGTSGALNDGIQTRSAGIVEEFRDRQYRWRLKGLAEPLENHCPNQTNRQTVMTDRERFRLEPDGRR
jgi:hypothetical protein